MAKLGQTVIFHPHSGHPRLADYTELAAIVGQVNADGTLDLLVLVPNAEPMWMDDVPVGTGHFSWKAQPDVYELANTAMATAADAQATAKAAHGIADAAHALAGATANTLKMGAAETTAKLAPTPSPAPVATPAAATPPAETPVPETPAATPPAA